MDALGREGDQPGVDYWTNALQTGTIKEADFPAAFADAVLREKSRVNLSSPVTRTQPTLSYTPYIGYTPPDTNALRPKLFDYDTISFPSQQVPAAVGPTTALGTSPEPTPSAVSPASLLYSSTEEL
jgi:hypothetical protein